MPQIKFKLNGHDTEASYEPGMHLLEVLREECGIVSAKNGCAPEGACGCCLVVIDGRPALSCLRKPEQMAGHDITTLEGLPEETRRIISEAFVLEGGVQCGFCIPGIVVRAASLIQQGKTDDRDAIAKALDGHVCRCTGYGRIIDAIQTAGDAMKNGGTLPGRAAAAFVLRRRVQPSISNPKFEFASRKSRHRRIARASAASQVLGGASVNR
jgi:xanthine dehydrogenase molybdenum-binding subunit